MSENCKKSFDGFALDIHLAQYLENVSWNCSKVIHPCWFVFWNPVPGAVISCGEQTFEVTPLHAYLIPPYTVISGTNRRRFNHFYAHFDAGEPFNNCVNQIYVLSPEPAKRFFQKYFELDELHKMLGWRIMILEYLAMLPEQAFSSSKNNADESIARVLENVKKDLTGSWSNRRMARLANMSENNFYRHFIAVLGVSPQKYIRGMLLNEARYMLVNSCMSIDDIARKTGFADRYSFSKAFKNFFAVSPGFLRRNCKN